MAGDNQHGTETLDSMKIWKIPYLRNQIFIFSIPCIIIQFQ
jgi:hypothetical protein